MITMDLIKNIGIVLGLVTALCALFGGLFWGFKYFLELYLKPLEQNQVHIKELLSNHVTGTDKKIDKLTDGQNELKAGQSKLEAGQSKLEAGQDNLKTDVKELKTDVKKLLEKK